MPPKKNIVRKRSERATRDARRKRIEAYRFARVIIASAVVVGMALPKSKYPPAPSYYKIAEDLQLDRKHADVADEIYNDVNGADEWSLACEERAMERLQTLLEAELEDEGS